jgi:hypothetical protein
VDQWNDKFIDSLRLSMYYPQDFAVGIDQYEGWVEYEGKKRTSRAGCTNDWYKKRKDWISSFRLMKEGKC